ncbi:dephospho-CoA kinase [Spiroplasma endosymbiont of Virgichneumon dumeticola]|uniref:dephospho-CoA kinase n=1 Tax=Spiroplasma endosymbiont of Virgichneumon dumeticola TaxID=3139323 RepID=UPI0035C9280E
MIIGIVGEAGVGKTTATEFFQSMGAYVISVDKIVHHIYSLKETKIALINELGNHFLNSDKNIDKKKLRQEAFQNPEILRKLEQIIWPTMINIIKTDIERNKCQQSLIVIDCAVLFNANLNVLVDKVLLIEAEEDKKVHRVKTRDNVNDLQVIALLSQQKKYLILNKDIDYIIKNNGTINDLIRQLQRIEKKLIVGK